MDDLLVISSLSEDLNGYLTEHFQYPELDHRLVFDLTQNVQGVKGLIYYQIPPPPPSDAPFSELRHGAISPAEVIVAVGSAGIFTAVYQAIASYLKRHKDRELTLKKGEVAITIKGHSLPEETDLLKALAPELLPGEENGAAEGEVA